MKENSAPWPLPLVRPEDVGLCSDRLQRASDLVRQCVDSATIAGAVLVVARRGGIALLETHGMADLERRVPMRADAILRIHSMSKIVTTVGLLSLMEEGRFLLSEPVARFLPELADPRVATTRADGGEELVPARRPITFEHLLTHLSGIDYEWFREARERGLDLAAFVEGLRTRPLRRHPGEQWMYGASTDVCGCLIERISGQPLEAFLRGRIFEPLGMVDTGFHVPAEKAARLAVTYQPEQGAAPAEQMAGLGWSLRPEGPLVPSTAFMDQRGTEPPKLVSGGGGLLSTTCDYLRFALMLLGWGTLDGHRVLGRKTVDLMVSDHLPPGHPPIGVNRRGFGLGVSVLRNLGETQELGSVGEFGWGGAACTQVWIDPDEEMVTMIMPQYRPAAKFALMDLYKQAVYQALL